MTLLRLCALTLLGVGAALILKQWKSDLLPLFRISLLVVGGALLFSLVAPILEVLQSLFDGSGVSLPHGKNLLKALGIALLAEFCADICRESGESGAASIVELTGKLEILLLSLPLLEEILTAARELLSMGGAP